MKTVDREKLWGEYQKNPSSALREKLITEYAPLVKVVAGQAQHVSWIQCGIRRSG